jgi:hypothetical protein
MNIENEAIYTGLECPQTFHVEQNIVFVSLI